MKPMVLLKLKIVSVLVLLCAGIAFTLNYTLTQAKVQKEAEVSANVENFGRLLDQSISSSASKIDLSLLGIADQLHTQLLARRQLDSASVNQMLALRKEWHAGEVEFRVTDQDGWVRYGPGVNPSNLASYADRPFFAELRTDGSSKMTVSKPVLGKVSKLWVIVYARRYNHPDGRFAGVIAAAVPISSLTRLLKSLDLGPSGVALLRDQEGGLLARYPDIDSPSAKIGAKIYSTELAAIMASGKVAVTYHTKNAGDNAERVVNYRRLQTVPFHLIVGIGPDDYLADWRSQARNTIVIGSGFLLLISLFAWGLWRAFSHSENARLKSEQALAERDTALVTLKDQSNLLSELVESLPYGLVAYDEQRVKKLSNSKFGAILKIPQALLEKAGFTFYEFIQFCHERGDYTDAESVDQRYARLTKAMDERRVFGGERRQADGAYIEFRAFPISNGWTAITYLDNSERHRQQAKLNETQARAQLAAESAGIGIWEFNLITGVLHWDAQQYRLHGMEPDSGSKDYAMWAQKVHPDDLPQAQLQFQQALETRTDFVAEFRVVWSDASVHHILALGRLSFDDEGKPTRMVGTNRDKTDSVLAANALKDARDKAEQANISKSLFLANMSHEIRTPMNAILGLLQLLAGTPLKPGQQDYVEKITGSAKSLLGLLNDILDFSKIEADKLDLTSEPFEIEHLLQEVGVVLAAYVGTKPVDLVFDIDPQIPDCLVGDALRLRQILVNLAGNAIKFTAQGQVVISLRMVSANRNSTEPVLLECVIEDSGIGIAPENLPLLFNSFTQAESTTTRRFGGTGLGLAICKRLVEMMGGTIGVTSEVGVGSKFSFQVALPEALLPGTRNLRGAQRKHVLLVDDNPVSCRAVRHMMEPLGWHLEVATTCEEAFAHLQVASAGGLRFDAVLMDSQLRPSDGWEALKRIAALHATSVQSGTRVVMLGVNARDRLDLRTAQERALVDIILPRPFSATALRGALEESSEVTDIEQEQSLKGARALEGLRILVVEDNAINQQVAEELLTQQGAVVSIASDGRQGVNAIASAKTQYDVVLMDVQMPVMDGYEATQTIREKLGLITLPIIGLTANAMATDRERCLHAGMSDHLSKPFDLAQLVKTIQQWAPSSRAATAPKGTAESPQNPPQLTEENSHVDAAQALARMGGMVGAYVGALTGFGSQLSSLRSDLLAAIEAADISRAESLLHTLKGNAATVGLTALANQLRNVEKQFNTTKDLAYLRGELPALTTLEQEAQQLIPKIIADLPGHKNDSPSAADSADSSRGDVDAVLVRLAAYLGAQDYEALTYFSDSRGILEQLPIDQFRQLESAIQSLDFEAALQICEITRS